MMIMTIVFCTDYTMTALLMSLMIMMGEDSHPKPKSLNPKP